MFNIDPDPYNGFFIIISRWLGNVIPYVAQPSKVFFELLCRKKFAKKRHWILKMVPFFRRFFQKAIVQASCPMFSVRFPVGTRCAVANHHQIHQRQPRNRSKGFSRWNLIISQISLYTNFFGPTVEAMLKMLWRKNTNKLGMAEKKRVNPSNSGLGIHFLSWLGRLEWFHGHLGVKFDTAEQFALKMSMFDKIRSFDRRNNEFGWNFVNGYMIPEMIRSISLHFAEAMGFYWWQMW